jgi:hypothetical protein
MTRPYRQTTYYTLTGLKKLIDLGDQNDGEWIVYEDGQPKYHVEVFSELRLLLKKEKIETILDTISKANDVNLSLGKRPLIEIVKETKLVTLDLGPLPESWVQQIIT